MNAKSSDMYRWCSRKKNQPAPKRESHSPDACSSSACLLGKRIILQALFALRASSIPLDAVGGGPVELEAAVSVSRIWRLGVCQSSQEEQTTILAWLALPGPSEARAHRSEDSGQWAGTPHHSRAAECQAQEDCSTGTDFTSGSR